MKNMPPHGCQARTVVPPPNMLASQKSRGDHKARPVRATYRKLRARSQCTVRSVTLKRFTLDSFIALMPITHKVEEGPKNAAEQQRIANPFQRAFPERNSPWYPRIFRKAVGLGMIGPR